MRILGSIELKQHVIDQGLCIGCGACIDLCPYFKSYKGKTANLFPCELSQGRCFAYCPKVEVDLDEISKSIFGHSYSGDPLGTYRMVKISKAGPKIGSGNFQCGGTISALMTYALEKGYIDVGVVTDKEGILPVPRLVEKPQDVAGFSGSKYTAAPTLAELNRAIKKGYRKIGLVGTPCQVLAAAQIQSNPFEEQEFENPMGLVLGLFCTWALDFRLFEPYISEVVDINDIIKIDIPPPPAEIMEILTKDEKIEVPLEEIRAIVSGSCSYCPDMTSEFSDISVGVLEKQPGYNTLIVRTERGEKIVREAVEAGYLYIDEMPEESLEHLIWAAGNKKQRSVIKANNDGRLNTSEKGRFSIFRISEDIVEKILGSSPI